MPNGTSGCPIILAVLSAFKKPMPCVISLLRETLIYFLQSLQYQCTIGFLLNNIQSI